MVSLHTPLTAETKHLIDASALSAMKNSAILINTAVTRGLDRGAAVRDSGIPWIGEIPAHWELKRAKNLFAQSRLPVREGDGVV